jgi:hypothetical protein
MPTKQTLLTFALASAASLGLPYAIPSAVFRYLLPCRARRPMLPCRRFRR